MAPLSGPEAAGAFEEGTPFAYERPPRDRRWVALFALAWLLCVCGGIVGAVNRNPAYGRRDVATAAECPLPGHPALHPGRRLAEPPPLPPSGFDATTAMVWWLFASTAASLLPGAALVWLYKAHAEATTHAGLLIQAGGYAAAGAGLLLVGGLGSSDAFAPGAVLLLVGAVLAAAWRYWREQIQLTARLLRVSANGLAANPGLVPLVLGLALAGLCAMGPLVVSAGFVLQNGELGPNPARGGSPKCVDALTGKDVPCCVFNTASWASAYLALPWVFTLIWTNLLFHQARIFVVAGTIAQWYFAAPSAATRGAMMRSVRHAAGPALGTLCFGALVTTLAHIVRRMAENLRRRGVLGLVLSIPLRWVASLVEYLTKYAVIMAAISGEPLVVAGRRAVDLLARNCLEAITTTLWFAPLSMLMTCLTLAAAWGCGNAGLFSLLVLAHGAAGEAQSWAAVITVGWVSAALSLPLLIFLGGIVLNVLDAAFLCWAMDRDASTVSAQKDVYDAFCALPLKPAAGAVVEGPDGRVSYGAELTALRDGASPASPSGDRQQRQPLLAGGAASVELA
ncbi:hypothetical protein ABPG77_005786 [Micractinium sp. CCAP 211/92]